MFDKDNFVYMLEDKFKVVMYLGYLEINDCYYEENEDDPIYAFARVVESTIALSKEGLL